MRKADLTRKTKETDITLSLDLDGKGAYEIASGSGFFDHMLQLFTAHGLFDLSLSCKGDVEVDFHHSAEDIGIALGTAFKVALGDKKGIKRYGSIVLPMDEALILAAVDISGRGYLGYDVTLRATKLSDDGEAMPAKVGDFDTELVEEFLLAFVRNADVTLHVKQLSGSNTHHIIEGVFKALGRALRAAVESDARTVGVIPSTKGAL